MDYIKENVLAKFKKNAEGKREIVKAIKQVATDITARVKQEAYSLVVKIKDKVYELLGIKREEARAAKVDESRQGRYAAVLRKLGLDVDVIKRQARERVDSMVQFGFFNPDKF